MSADPTVCPGCGCQHHRCACEWMDRPDRLEKARRDWIAAVIERRRREALDQAVRDFYGTGTPGGDAAGGLKSLIDENPDDKK